MVNTLLHLILPTTLNVQDHGVPHLTSSWLIFLFQLLSWQPSYRYNLAVPFFSYTTYLLPSALGFHAKNVTRGINCSAILMQAQTWKCEGVGHWAMGDRWVHVPSSIPQEDDSEVILHSSSDGPSKTEPQLPTVTHSVCVFMVIFPPSSFHSS